MEHFDDYSASRGRLFKSPNIVTAFGYGTVFGDRGPTRGAVVFSCQPSLSGDIRYELSSEVATTAACNLHMTTVDFLADKLNGPTRDITRVVGASLAMSRDRALEPTVLAGRRVEFHPEGTVVTDY